MTLTALTILMVSRMVAVPFLAVPLSAFAILPMISPVTGSSVGLTSRIPLGSATSICASATCVLSFRSIQFSGWALSTYL